MDRGVSGWEHPPGGRSMLYPAGGGDLWAPRTRKRHQQDTGRSGRQNAATRHNMRREDRVTVQGPVKKQQPDGLSHRGSEATKKFVYLKSPSILWPL